MASRLFIVVFPVAHFRGWYAAIIALALPVQINAQQPSSPPAGAQRFTDATTKLIAAINADDQPAIQQMFNDVMQEALPAEKTGPFFRGLLSAKGKLQEAGAPEVSGPTAKVLVTAERGDWQFEITLDPSDEIAGLRVLPGDDKPGRKEEPPPATIHASNEETTYFELRRSKDRLTQQVAERYFNLVKLQEWSDATGKFKTIAKYVAHDPNLQWVKLSAIKGSGASRVAKEVTVPVGRLSKTCQSRVRQIVTLQKKLDELAAAATESSETGPSGAGGFPQGDPGAPMVDERGIEPRGLDQAGIDRARGANSAPADFSQGPGAAPSSSPAAPIEGESDPDPLGFAELPPVAAPGPNTGAFDIPLPAGALAAVPPSNLPVPGAAEEQAGNADPAQWSQNYASFRANFRVDSATGEVNWNNLEALRAMGQTAATGQEAPAERLEEVRWEATFRGTQPAEPHVLVLFDVPPLPPPLQIEFRLDRVDRATAAEWPQFSPGDRVSFTGRLAMSGPTSIVVHVREPKLVQAASPTRNR